MDNLDTGKISVRIANWFKQNIIIIFLLILSIYFIFSGAVTILPQELDWWEKLVYIFTTLIFGFVISQLVAEGGYTRGKQNKEFINTKNLYIELGNQITELGLREEAEEYVSQLIDKDIYKERYTLLAKVGIKYNKVFDEKGVLILTKQEIKQMKKAKRHAIKKALHIKKYEFVLFGFSSTKIVGRKKAPNETERRAKKVSTSFIIKVLIAIASGSVMFSWLGLSLGTLIYSIFQLLIWFGSGLIGYVSNYNFIVNNMKEYNQERIWYLKSFIALSSDEKHKLEQIIEERNFEENKALKTLNNDIPQNNCNIENQN